ncbi:unnamed protein product [Closterium sp. NIES-53]
MRASLQFRQGDGSHHSPCGPLFRLKLPVSLLGLPLPLFSGCSLGSAPSDVSLSLGTAFTAGPSLRLTYRPIRAPVLSAAPRDDSTDAAGDSGGNSASLHLVLKAGLGRLGSSRDASLSVAAELEFCPSVITAGGAPSSGVGGSGFRVPLRAHIRFKAEPRVGDLSFRRFPSAAAAAAPKAVAVASAEIPPSRSAKPCAQSSSGSGEPSVSACTALSIGPRSRSSSPQSGGSSNGGSQGGSRGGSRGGSPGPGAVGGEEERTSADGLATPTAAACNGIPPAASSAISSPRGPASAAAAAASSPSGKNSGSSSEGVVAGGASDSPPGEGAGGGVGMAQLALSSSAAVPAARVLSQRLTLSPSPPHSPTAAAAAAAATAAAAAAVAAVAASGQHLTWQWSAADVANAVRNAGWGIGVRSSVPLGTHGVASLRWRLTLPHSTPSPSSPPPPPPAPNPPAGSPNTNTRSSSSSGWLSSAHAPTLHLDKISVDVRTGAFRFIPACWAMHEPQPPLPDSLPQPLPTAATTGAGITTTRPPSLPTPTTLVLPGVAPRLLLMPSGPLGFRPALVPPGGSAGVGGRGQGGGGGMVGEQGEVARLRSELVGVRAEGQRLRQQVDELRAAVSKAGAGEAAKAGGVGETKGKGGKEGGVGATAAPGRAEAGKGGGSAAAAAGSGGSGKDGKAAAPAPSAAGSAPAGVGAGSKAQSGGSGGSEKEKQGGGLFGRWRGRGDKKEEKKEKLGTTSSGSSSSSGGGSPGSGGAAGSGSSVPVASKTGPASSAAAGAAASPEGLGRPGMARGSGAGAGVGVDIPVSASRADLTAVRNSPAHGHGQGYGHGHGHSTLLHAPGATMEGNGPAVGKGSVAGQGALGASAGAVAAQLELEEGLRQAILQARAGAA